ncbi:nudC domain-containing protein 1 isoform X1 [Diaphorina citri]|uniref:NudC domain-containing protein 1 isoform X1 n=1 Tax=Diaphorina citri TaxID=121845 RepID=A0A1S3DJR1_DIACI|nr:nudC domain-containing protein 1 isoform X1 [Diaphorina citri]
MQQLEECDSMASEDKALVRIDGELHCSTHHMNLGGHQCLFSASLSPTQCPALCLRHDVDGALLQIDEDGTGEVSVKHEGTLQAFGYVQASKTQRKFSTCAPDMSYGVICESSRHVFLYVQSSRVTSELRHRVTGRRVPSVSKQYVVTLTDNAEVVLGVIAARACLYLLTSVHLYMIKVES